MPAKPRVSIEYCPRCGWMLRATWLAQELLTTFERELGGVELVPSEASGTFEVRVGADVVWERRADHGFPQAADLKRRVRDRIAPGRSLGHSDAGAGEADRSDSGPAEAGHGDSDPAEAGHGDSDPAEAGRGDSGPADRGAPPKAG